MTSNLPPLLFDGEIRDREEQKAQRKGVRLRGFDVFLAEFTTALFRYSSCGAVHFTSEAAAGFLRNPPSWFQRYRHRCRFVSAFDPESLARLEQAILLSLGQEMIQFAWLRSRLERPEWPITAILHSLSPAPRIRYFFTNVLLARLGPQDALVCPTRAARTALINLFQSVPESTRGAGDLGFQLPVIPLGVSIEEYGTKTRAEARKTTGLPADATIVHYFGRLSPADKCDLVPLLLAFARVGSREDLLLVLAGDDTQFRMAPVLQRAAAELGLGERVRVMPDPDRSTKHDLLAAADIFLAPYDHLEDSFPLSIVEAMAAGLPVVASEWGGNGELVEHGSTGLLVPAYLPPASSPWDTLTLYTGLSSEASLAMSTSIDIDALAQAMQTLVDRPALRDEMGARAREKVMDRFDWRAVIARYDDLWRDLCARSAGRQTRGEAFAPLAIHDVFRHYPTRILEGSDQVMVAGNAALASCCASPPFRTPVAAAILEAAADGPARIEWIVARVSESQKVTRFDVERHVGRLLKYGALRLGGAPAGSADLRESSWSKGETPLVCQR